MGGRADLRRTRSRPLHLLRRQVPAERANLRRLATALRELNATLRVPGVVTSTSRVMYGEPRSSAAIPPMTTYRTPCRSRTSSNTSGRYGTDSDTTRYRFAVLQLIMETNPLEQVGKPLGRRHLEVLVDDHCSRLVQFGEMEGELEAAASNDLSKGLEAGDYGTALPTGDDRLLLADPLAQFGLGQAGSEPGFSDQLTTHHRQNIVQICYANTGARALT